MILLASSILWAVALPWTTRAVATPLRGAQAPLLSSEEKAPGQAKLEGGGDEVMFKLLAKYAPIIKLSAEEEYFPSSIEYMLPHFTFIENDSGESFPSNQSLLTPAALDQLPQAGAGLWLSIPESHNPQPFLFDPASEYLYGPKVKPGKGDDERARVEEDVYGFWVEKERGVVDLWYWTYYPFNLGKLVGPFGHLGNHVSDWEHLRMRTIDGEPVSADYMTHNGGTYSAGTVRWSDVLKIDGRPVGFSAAGSHGLWPTPGDHVYANLLNAFRLVDVTDDIGPIWDTLGHVVPAKYWSGPEQRRKLWHRGEGSWLNFRGRWGNKGVQDCWWHKLIDICQLVDAPGGPNRFFGNPPDCITAPLTWESSSTYAFYLASSIVDFADDHGIKLVQVEQTCARPRQKDDDSDDDGDDDDEGDNWGEVDYVHDLTKEEDLVIWRTGGVGEYKRGEKHVISVSPCSGVRSSVKSYRISLCLADGKCVSTSQDRKICSYEKGKKGYHFGNAVDLEDVDSWRWQI